MKSEKGWELMCKYVSNQISLHETERLLDWIGNDSGRAELLRNVQESWDRTKDYPEFLTIDTDLEWLRFYYLIKDNTTNTDSDASKRRLTTYFFLIIAAIAACLAAWLFIS